MKPGDRVVLRSATGELREGRIIRATWITRAEAGYDWRVAWQGTNFDTLERAEDLRSAEVPIRRTVARETRGLHVAKRAGGAR